MGGGEGSIAIFVGRGLTRLNVIYLVAGRRPCYRVSGVWTIAFGEARVAADAIGSLALVYRLGAA